MNGKPRHLPAHWKNRSCAFKFDDFSIVTKNNRMSVVYRKILDTVYIRQLKPSINIQGKSDPLKLFNGPLHMCYNDGRYLGHILCRIVYVNGST